MSCFADIMAVGAYRFRRCACPPCPPSLTADNLNNLLRQVNGCISDGPLYGTWRRAGIGDRLLGADQGPYTPGWNVA